jgi:hypothetical protein
MNFLKEYYQRAKVFTLHHIQKCYRLGMGYENLHENRYYLFLLFSWIVFFNFVFGSFISGNHPWRLLVPFSLYGSPSWDSRDKFRIYVSDGETLIFPSQRLMYRTGDKRQDTFLLVNEVGAPPSAIFEEGDDINYAQNLKRLPNLSPALISVWFPRDGKSIILDFQESKIKSIIDSYLTLGTQKITVSEEEEDQDSVDTYYQTESPQEREKRSEILEDRKRKALELTFRSIEKTILENIEGIEKLEFHLDGESKDYPRLNYSLKEIKIK